MTKALPDSIEAKAVLKAVSYTHLEENSLDDFTYQKALQKITESNCVNSERKAVIRKMKNQNRK